MFRAGRIRGVGTGVGFVILAMMLLYSESAECYPHKRATGGVPHILHELLTDGQRMQTSEAQLLTNATLSSTPGLPLIANLLEMQSGMQRQLLENMINATLSYTPHWTSSISRIANSLEMQSLQLENLINATGKIMAPLNTLTKGLQLTAGDCSDVADQGPYVSGIYMITTWDDMGYKSAFKVYCDMKTEGGGWTVFQKRFNGSVDFYRDWQDYTDGVGNINGEYWLGLTNLNRLTSTYFSWQLRVDIEDFEGNTVYAQYEDFRIGNESTHFQLTVGGYSGTAGDSLTYHSSMPFTTMDRDNYYISGNCAVKRGGAWWYNNCAYFNLNGPYISSTSTAFNGVTWYHWTNTWAVLKQSQMKIRPAK